MLTFKNICLVFICLVDTWGVSLLVDSWGLSLWYKELKKFPMLLINVETYDNSFDVDGLFVILEFSLISGVILDALFLERCLWWNHFYKILVKYTF